MAGRQGLALVTAMAAALIVSMTALLVLNLVWRRFELSAFRTDHEVALAAAEAGLQYASARLDLDMAFRQEVQRRAPNEYLVVCHADVPTGQGQRVDQLHMAEKINTDPGSPDFDRYGGGKHMELRVRFYPAGSANRPAKMAPSQDYEVRARVNYGTGSP